MVRGLRGMWACCDPQCSAVDSKAGGRRVGRLFTTPRATCTCGSRVLELLYCFECGDISLGGYVVKDIDAGVRLLGTTAVNPGERRAVPVFKRTWNEYAWYWPLPAGWDGSLEAWKRSVPKKACAGRGCWTIGGDPVIRHSIARPAHWPPPTKRPSDWPCPRDIRKRKGQGASPP